MGQYHHPVNFTAFQSLSPHNLGSGLKAWEQICGGIPAALAGLLAHNPGNAPGDLGHHPMVGKWAGHRIAIIGDYADDDDIPGYKGTPLSRVYELCLKTDPNIEDYSWGTEADRNNQVKEALENLESLKEEGIKPYADITKTLFGLIEEALSIRFCGTGWKAEIPVKPRAEKDVDGKAHYDINLTGTEEERNHSWRYFMRVLGFNETTAYPEAVGLERWPWDRPPADLAWDNTRDAEIDQGQTRVFANLTKREFIDPIKFGEVPTTAGIMRSSAHSGAPRVAMDMIISSKGVETDVKEGASEYGSASALFALLLHPENRGGGDILADEFPEIGRWRHDELVLTSEFGGDFPSTDEVKATFTDVSDVVLKAMSKIPA